MTFDYEPDGSTAEVSIMCDGEDTHRFPAPRLTAGRRAGRIVEAIMNRRDLL